MSRGSASLRSEEMFETENNRLLESVRAKASMMKSVSLDMNREVKSQNMQLGDMGSDFDGAGGLLGSTMNRLNTMVKTGNTKFMFYVIAVILIVFFFIYYLASRRS